MASTNQCAQFTLRDQFDAPHDFKFPHPKPTLLTVADREGSEQIEAWAHPLAERFGDRITIAGLADVSSVPGLLQGMVRSKFKKAIEYPVMLDWSGEATRGFNYTKGKANVYLITTDGFVVQHMDGEADAGLLKQLGDRIETLLTNAPPARPSLESPPKR